jgi:putative DNA primase/helicase
MLVTASESKRLSGKAYPAMVFPIVNSNFQLQGAQVTWLSRDGSTKLNAEIPRRIYGVLKGGYVPLGPLDANKPLIIAEGIETALSAAQIAQLPAVAALSSTNMPAVSLPVCREVIIAADNDEPGRKAARAAADHLALAGHDVKIAMPDAVEDGEKFDWNDALLSGRTIEELRESFSQATPIAAPRDIEPLPADEFQQLLFPERPNLLKPWLKQSSLAMIHAPRGAAKTWLALSVGYAVATGSSLMGWTVENAGCVMYVDGELPGGLLQKRLAQLGPSSANFLILSRDQFHLRKALMPDLGERAGREFLDEIIERNQVDLVILDSLSTLVRSGVENDAESWAPIQDWALGHRWRGRTILFVHHEGRAGKPRGTSKREDVLDSMIGLKARPDLSRDHDAAFDLSFTKSREFYGRDAADLLIRLSLKSGTARWACETAEKNMKERVAKMLNQGWKQANIAKELEVTPGRVSQIVAQIRQSAPLRAN